MRLSNIGTPGNPRYHIWIETSEPFLWIRYAIAFLTPVGSPGGHVDDRIFKNKSDDYLFHATAEQYREFGEHMDRVYPSWSSQIIEIAEELDPADPTDLGIKTPAVRQGKDDLDAMFEPYEKERQRGERAIRAHEPQRDIIHERKEMA